MQLFELINRICMYFIYLAFPAQPFEEVIGFKLCLLIGNYPRHLEDKPGFGLLIKSDRVKGKHACQRRGVTHFCITRLLETNKDTVHTLRTQHTESASMIQVGSLESSTRRATSCLYDNRQLNDHTDIGLGRLFHQGGAGAWRGAADQ